MSVPPISPGEMQLLLSRAGLVLNPGQVADLVLAWRQVAGLIAAIPHDRPLADDMALTFRLPPPAAASRPRPSARPRAIRPAEAKARQAEAAPGRRPRQGESQGRTEAACRQAAPRKRARRGR